MVAGKSNILVQASLSDLQTLIDDNVAEAKYKALLSRFDNVLVGVKDIAHFHNVSTHTVTSYIKDGLIVPEIKVNENDHPRFRLSYALTLDFKELQKQLRAKRKAY